MPRCQQTKRSCSKHRCTSFPNPTLQPCSAFVLPKLLLRYPRRTGVTDSWISPAGLAGTRLSRFRSFHPEQTDVLLDTGEHRCFLSGQPTPEGSAIFIEKITHVYPTGTLLVNLCYPKGKLLIYLLNIFRVCSICQTR